MLRNLPINYSRDMLLAMLDKRGFAGPTYSGLNLDTPLGLGALGNTVQWEFEDFFLKPFCDSVRVGRISNLNPKP